MNGVSLLGLDNARAIHVLREAMMTDGRIRGFIGITVLRPRNNAGGAQLASPCREVHVSQADNEDIANGTVSSLPWQRPSPVQRLNAATVSNKDTLLSATLPADIAQVGSFIILPLMVGEH